MRDAEDLLREVHDLLDGGVVQEPAAPAEDPPPRQPEREQVPVVPRRAVAGRRHRPRRRAARVVLVIVVALAAVAAGVLTVRELRTSGPRNGDRPATAPAVPQDVLAWTVWTEQPTRAYVAVLATSEDLEPVALTVPGHLIVSIPGRGVGTIGDAAAGGNAELVGTTVSSVLGVEVDETVASSLEELGGIVDALGGIDIGEGRSSGARVVRYLRAKDRDADFRAIRWQ
ncbi:MAG TPA: hypothetical protein VM638_00130, partial [Actinomycetota bacterium]|nr:hypothetical protein [Actinomycetota bacterium]